MTTQTQEAMKLAREALEEIALAGMSGVGGETPEELNAFHARQARRFIGTAARALEPLKAAIEQAEKDAPLDKLVQVQEDLGMYPDQAKECRVCAEVHTLLDNDESKIIRNAKDGYPDGRASRVLTLQERVAALCKYGADWKRWCIKAEAEQTVREAVKPGWKLVPVEPTEEMLKAAHDALESEGLSTTTWLRETCYRAMLNAAPTQPQEDEGGPAGSGGWKFHAEQMERERDYWEARAHTMSEHQRGEYWYWQGDGSDHPESMVNSLPVVIRADDLRALIAPTQPQEQAGEAYTYASKQATNCAKCGKHKHTPLRVDWMGGYVCLTCIGKELDALREWSNQPQPAPPQERAGELIAYEWDEYGGVHRSFRYRQRNGKYPDRTLKLYTRPSARDGVAICEHCENERPVIHAPVREWVGLTGAQIDALPAAKGMWWPAGLAPRIMRLVRDAEAKLKEMNTAYPIAR